MASMDLTPTTSTPWRSLFRCCLPPASPSPSSDTVEQDACDVSDAKNATATSTLKLEVTTEGKVIEVAGPETPATTCTEESADASFESEYDDFIGEIAVSTPRSKAAAVKSVSFADELESSDDETVAEEEVVAGEGEESDSDGAMSDPDEESYWYADTSGLNVNQSPMRVTKTRSAARNGRRTNTLAQEQAEVGFYYFMLAMMLRYMFGTWLPGGWDPMTNIFGGKLLLTQENNSEKKRDVRKTMTLRTLQVNEDKCEVVPQLKREVPMTAIDE